MRPRVFVVCPLGVRSGGPEALHQLVRALLDLDVDASMVAARGTGDREPVEEYAKYGVPIAGPPPDADDVLVVAPESYIRTLTPYRRATILVWWLSIDNAPVFFGERLRSRGFSPATVALRTARRYLKSGEYSRRTTLSLMDRSFHAVQSTYAWSYLNTTLRASPAPLTDYIDLAAFDDPVGLPARSGHLARVAFNPAKGADVVRELQRRRLNVEWVPIVGMAPQAVADSLRNAHIYLDVGHHPGKDRIPREAALSGALVLVARLGAAAFRADVPIPETDKISIRGDVVANTEACLRSALADIEARTRGQDAYRNWIRGERERFYGEVRSLFVDLVFESGEPRA